MGQQVAYNPPLPGPPSLLGRRITGFQRWNSGGPRRGDDGPVSESRPYRSASLAPNTEGSDPHRALPALFCSNPTQRSQLMDTPGFEGTVVVDGKTYPASFVHDSLLLEVQVGVDIESMAGCSDIDAIADIWNSFVPSITDSWATMRELKRLRKQGDNPHRPVTRRPRRSHRDRSRYSFQGYRGGILLSQEVRLPVMTATGRIGSPPSLQNIPEVQP